MPGREGATQVGLDGAPTAVPSVAGQITLETVRSRNGAVVASAKDANLIVDERALRVGVRGQLTTFISDRRVSEVSKGYAIELQYSGGRVFLKAFRETNPNDPLENQPRPSSAAAVAQ